MDMSQQDAAQLLIMQTLSRAKTEFIDKFPKVPSLCPRLYCTISWAYPLFVLCSVFSKGWASRVLHGAPPSGHFL
jgi:hypothetical protein